MAINQITVTFLLKILYFLHERTGFDTDKVNYTMSNQMNAKVVEVALIILGFQNLHLARAPT